MTTIPVPTEIRQRAIISWLAKNCGENGLLGKTALQKLVYALTYIKDVDTGYKFSLYTYGPFSKDLQADLDTADLLKSVSVEYIGDQNRYIVKQSENTDSTIKKADHFISANISSLTWTAENLGGRSAKYLELFSTVHYILSQEEVGSDDAIVVRLIEIKPKFNKKETYDCLREVRLLSS